MNRSLESRGIGNLLEEKGLLATAITTIAAVYLFAGLLALAPRKAGYSHRKHMISEIGESGSPAQRFVSFGLFLPVGLLLLVVAYLVRPSLPPAAALALCIAAGYIGAAAFPCDPGSPRFGTWRQFLHNLAGGIEYIGGSFSLLSLAERYGLMFRFAGFAVLGAVILLSDVRSKAIRGGVQRIAEICLFGGLAAAIFQSDVAAL